MDRLIRMPFWLFDSDETTESSIQNFYYLIYIVLNSAGGFTARKLSAYYQNQEKISFRPS